MHLVLLGDSLLAEIGSDRTAEIEDRRRREAREVLHLPHHVGGREAARRAVEHDPAGKFVLDRGSPISTDLRQQAVAEQCEGGHRC